MSGPTKTYRVYCFDAVMKEVTANFIKALDDDGAIAQAEAAGFGSRCEIWDGDRLVAQLGGDRLQAGGAL